MQFGLLVASLKMNMVSTYSMYLIIMIGCSLPQQALCIPYPVERLRKSLVCVCGDNTSISHRRALISDEFLITSGISSNMASKLRLLLASLKMIKEISTFRYLQRIVNTEIEFLKKQQSLTTSKRLNTFRH